MITETVVITNQTGLHARPAALVVKLAGRFASDVALVKAGREFDAKSILGVMRAAVRRGETVTLQANGPDECQAVAAVAELIRSGLRER